MSFPFTAMELIVVFLFTIIAAWTIYHAPIAISGLLSYRRGKANPERDCGKNSYEPSVSVVIPVKNGASVLDRLMDSILAIDYPKEKMEIIFVEDGSTDGSYDICKKYETKFPGLVKVIHRDESRGKPEALACATERASGEILAIFDVDSIIDPNAFRLALRYFEDPKVAAVQGRTFSVNFRGKLLTWLVYLEEFWFSIVMMGRQKFGLFTPLTGNCMFIRKSYLEEVGGWDRDSLTEDVELSIRLVKHGYVVIYEKDIQCFQEAPTKLKHLALQRNRWYRGYLETLIRNLGLLKRFNRKMFDAVVLLSSPIIALLGQIFYPLVIIAATFICPSLLLQVILQLSLIPLVVSILTFAIMVLLLVKPREFRLLALAPLIYAYWAFLSVIVLKSCLDVVLGAPRVWVTTPKEGGIWSLSRAFS